MTTPTLARDTILPYAQGVSDDLLRRFDVFVPWARSLYGMDERFWLTPMGPGKWSIGECFAHLFVWDRYALTHRLPYFEPNASLPAGPTPQTLNNFAATYAKSGISRDNLIEQFVHARQALAAQFRTLPEDRWDMPLEIAGKATTPRQYLEEMVVHNEHHRRQIERFWRESLVSMD